MTQAPLPRNLPLLLLQTRETFLCHFRPILAHVGVSEQQWRIIRALDEAETLEPREICEICQILSPSLAGVLARMDKSGLVTRTRVDEDQRRVLVRLTEKSKKLVAAIRPAIAEQYRLIEKAYGAELIADLFAILDRLADVSGKPVGLVSLPKLDLFSKKGKDAPSDNRLKPNRKRRTDMAVIKARA